jgi:ABC-type transport system involved in cytochrome bd biosynthesis fused ATPase/permease subunit
MPYMEPSLWYYPVEQSLGGALFLMGRYEEASAAFRAALQRAPGAMRTSGELMQAAVDEVEAIDGHVARFLPARQAAALAPIIVLAAIAAASPVSAAILFATLVPFILALILAGGAAAALRRLADHPALAAQLAAAGRQAVREALDPAGLAAVVAERIGSLLRWGGRAELLAALPQQHSLRRLQ